MPDWSYQTLFRPLLFRLPARLSRNLTLKAIGSLSKIPGGAFVIRTFGHMEPSPLLERNLAGITVHSPIGLSGGLDPQGIAHRALAQFGIGFIEHGPITVDEIQNDKPIRNDRLNEMITYPDYFENDGVERFAARIAKPNHRLPQLARISPMPGAAPVQALRELERMMAKLSQAGAAGFYIDVLHGEQRLDDAVAILRGLSEVFATGRYREFPLFLYIPSGLADEQLHELIKITGEDMWSGIVIGEGVGLGAGEGSATMTGKASKVDTLSKIKLIRSHFNPNWLIKAGGGVHEPQDALDLLHAGADTLMLHSGLVYAGPGLPKRINEAIIYEQVRRMPEPAVPSFWKHWGWMCLLGIGMIIGGILSWIIAATTVLLPYDLSFIDMTLDELHLTNHNLLHFMSHDRITLSGTMISIGIIYFMLAWHGLRLGLHWARTALLTSGIVGFLSFFLYLGYGYFDPLHAAAAAVLLPMFLLSMRSNPDRPSRQPVNLTNDSVWRHAMWGQLCLVVLGFALAAGGMTISGVGITNVFVQTDLVYLDTSHTQINDANTKLIPLIAHDRAGFGGALLCDALAILIIALWGIQQGARWLWWTLLLGGIPGFYAGLSVHLSIGYIDFWHLSPAFFALLLYVLGLLFLYPYLMRSPRAGKGNDI